MRSAWGRTAACLALIVLGSCTSDRVQNIDGVLKVEGVSDFGRVLIGRDRSVIVHARNVGLAPLHLQLPSLEVPAGRDFLVESDARTLVPGEEVAIPIRFAPVALGVRAARLVLETDSLRTPQFDMALQGIGVLGDASVGPQVLDFGKVALRDESTLALHARNDKDDPAEIELGPVDGNDAEAFTAGLSGPIAVAPHSTVDVPVTFRPGHLGASSAHLAVRRCPSCAQEQVQLLGVGIDAALVVDPTKLDFGFVQIGHPAKRTVTVTNVGTKVVTLTNAGLGAGSGAAFDVAPLPANGVALGQDQSTTIDVTFAPTEINEQKGTLEIATDDKATPQLVVPLLGSGGGPRIAVMPIPLAFPRTGLGLTVDKSVTVRNVGLDPTGTHPLVVTRYAVVAGADFTVDGPALPITIPAGKQVLLTVHYRPHVEGRSDGTLVVESNDTTNTPVSVPLIGTASVLGDCTYQVNPASLDFGAVALGARARLAFVVKNMGANPCSIANVRLSPTTPPSFALTQVSTRMIDVGGQLVVPVEYDPSAAGPESGMVLFDVTSNTQPQAQVPLNALAIAPCLEVVPPTLDFGTVGLACQPPTLSVQVRNACSQPVDLQKTWIGAGTSDAFQLAPGEGAPQTLPPGAQLSLDVTYAPKTAGDDSAPLDVLASVSPTPFGVGLWGEAVLRPTHTDTFQQPEKDKVDFLFVIDNSGSMTEEQQGIADNFHRFIEQAVGRGVDFHIAVTTTGLTPYPGGWSTCPGGAQGGEAGRFFPTDNSGPRILTPTTPNLEQAFAKNVKVGTCHWWEEGLEAARLALSPPLINNADDPNTPEPNDGNLGFLRPDARLYVLYVSDADDSDSTPTAMYVSQLLALKNGRADQVSASAVVGFPSCSTIESPGTRYMAVVQALRGVAADICSPDWGGVMEEIGKDAFTPQTEFPLTEEPDGRDVAVQVDGADVPATAPDGSTQWHYDPTVGTYGEVVFDPAHAPGPGTTVTVTYPVPCPEVQHP